jgi:hypothetical protein
MKKVRQRRCSIRGLPASKREFPANSALKSHGMHQHYRGFLPALEEKLFFLKCYAVLRERFFLAGVP